MDWTVVIGSVLTVGAAVWGGVQWYLNRKKSPKPIEFDEIVNAVLDVLKKVQEDKKGVPVSAVDPGTPVVISRIEALGHINALATYLEATGQKDGLISLQSVMLSVVPAPPQVDEK